MPSRTEKGFQVINGLMLTLGWVIGAIVYSALKAQAGGIEQQAVKEEPASKVVRPPTRRKKLLFDDQRDLDPDQNMHLIEEARDLADRVILMQQEMGVTP